ncbi:CAP domain-containing protein [Camelliibacillus cellulosilyticus]|uniref:CAP domain-containing protein n=1 Tax=Camelliibacillus cellulosilyticus TaxID=2174486 RepID=A0ABV9GHW8_9BACL
MKKFLSLALAGAIALPLAAAHGAHAQSLNGQAPQANTHYSSDCYKNIDLNQILKEMNQNGSYKYIIKWMGKEFQPAYNGHISQKPTQAKPAQPTQNHQPTQSQQPTQDKNKQPSQNQSNSTLSQYEQQVVQLTNQERTKRGLKPLKIDANLSKMARDKSADMKDKNYFDHQSPTYGSPFDMMKKYGISYQYAGENIAAGQKTPQDVVNAWMNSEGHRENILNPNYTTIGVGYVSGGSYGSYWTQEFIGK